MSDTKMETENVVSPFALRPDDAMKMIVCQCE